MCELDRRHLTKDGEFCVPLLRICSRSIVKVTIIDHDAAGDLAVHRFYLPTISELPFTSDKDPLVTCCGRAQDRQDRRSDPVSTTTRPGDVARLLYGVNVIQNTQCRYHTTVLMQTRGPQTSTYSNLEIRRTRQRNGNICVIRFGQR